MKLKKSLECSDVTEGKVYEHVGSGFLDDKGYRLSVARFSWEAPELADVMIKISKPCLHCGGSLDD